MSSIEQKSGNAPSAVQPNSSSSPNSSCPYAYEIDLSFSNI